MEELELICFNMITAVGAARSNYIEAIHKAKDGEYEAAEKLMQEGKEFFVQGHKVHGELLAKDAGGESTAINLLVLHAEDQLMSAETFGILAEEFLDLYQKVNG